MRRLHVVLAAFAALAMAPMLAWGQAAGDGSPGTGIANTLHDFTNGVNLDATATNVPNTIADTGDAVGLCTFCHTPHKAQTTKLLWNHTLDTGASFTWNDATTTTAGTTLPQLDGGTYNGVSTKCLSCHDGSVAIGDVAWFAEAPRTGADVINGTVMTADGPTFVITNGGAGGSGAGSMNGNHPIGVPYPFGNVANTYNGITTGSGAVLTEWQSDPTGVSNVRLFHDDGTEKAAGPLASTTGIECSSCHDPHNKQAVDDLFLRGALTGQSQADGYICLQCHIK